MTPFDHPYANGSDSIYDYHMSVRNAFATSSALASQVNGLPGSGSKTITGHSLACGLIGAAISDQGMNVAHACFVDAALPREVFDGRVGSGSQLNRPIRGGQSARMLLFPLKRPCAGLPFSLRLPRLAN